MKPTSRGLAVGTTCLTLALGGCSWLVTDGPPAGHETMESFDCDEGRGPAWWDVFMTTFGLYLAATAESDTEGWYQWDAGTYIGVGFGIALVHGSSAWAGFRRTRECREAKEALRARMGG